jgi:Winged helix DNA-binding domain
MTRRTVVGSDEVLSRRALNRAFMARQLMIGRSPMAIADAIEHLVGLQGQVPLVPYTSLWSRLEGFRPDELGRMVTERAVVRTSLMRGTIHMVTARDALFLRSLLQPVIERVIRGSSPFGRAVAGVDEAALLASGRELVEAQPLTRARLSVRLAERFPGYDPLSLAVMASGLVPMVQVPPRGVWGAKSMQATWTTMSSWLRTPVGPAAPDALETMVLRYLAAFGPASVMDIQSWCWLTKLGAVVERLRPRLRTFRDERGRELVDVPDGPRPDPDTPIPPRFLGEYDNLFLSHADRARIGTIDLAERNFRKGPFFVDGFGHGCWDLIRDERRATAAVEPFRPLARADRLAVAEEAARLAAFLAPDAESYDVRFDGEFA